ALIPTVLIMALGLNAKLPFGGTTILIIAGVGLDTLRQAKAQTEQFQYTGFLLENVESGTKSLPSTVGGSHE
ncbi:preprotein translocase subunit SecY, partial [Bifidobacterium longum]